eukprot:TRINITY_DN5265_c1_g1_i1.p1 TRINITY_DN5265_c1_g1~~TRINITY_DN5265_c1_g1_i1.p1  ORF type:complete len:217 (+),score=53.71 TRINITY_DN5265_c1_g1_i1:106-756(+)
MALQIRISQLEQDNAKKDAEIARLRIMVAGLASKQDKLKADSKKQDRHCSMCEKSQLVLYNAEEQSSLLQEENDRLVEELAAKDKQLAAKDKQLADKDKQLAAEAEKVRVSQQLAAGFVATDTVVAINARGECTAAWYIHKAEAAADGTETRRREDPALDHARTGGPHISESPCQSPRLQPLESPAPSAQRSSQWQYGLSLCSDDSDASTQLPTDA